MKLYVASKLSNAPLLLHKRHLWKGAPFNIEVTSRWLDLVGHEVTASAEDFRDFWLIDLMDIRGSDALFIYGEPEHGSLRGALVEAGYALGCGLPVIACGNAPCFGTWKHHPMVRHFFGIEEAELYLANLARKR